ncbi:hypothetical protein PQX77_005519, partial [Marasmius sp. AFHP31]
SSSSNRLSYPHYYQPNRHGLLHHRLQRFHHHFGARGPRPRKRRERKQWFRLLMCYCM